MDIRNIILSNLSDYRENLELLQMQRKELLGDKKETKKTLRLAKQLEKQGLKVEGLENINDTKDIEEIEEQIKVLKSLIRRYETILAMYSIQPTEKVIINQNY